MSDTIKFGYSASSNISFRGEIETDISREDWDGMTPREQDDAIEEALWDLVNIYPIED